MDTSFYLMSIEHCTQCNMFFLCSSFLIKRFGEESVNSARILLQHLCSKVPDKAEYRAKTAQSVVEITKFLPVVAYAKIVQWLKVFSRNEKV